MQQSTSVKLFDFIDNIDKMTINNIINKYFEGDKKKQDYYELEVRFGEFNEMKFNRFSPSINEKTYYSILNYLETHKKIELIEANQEIKKTDVDGLIQIQKFKEYNPELIKSYSNKKEYKFESTCYMKKEKINYIDLVEYGLRICLSKEIDIKELPKMKKVSFELFKDKKRFFYKGIYIDILKTLDDKNKVMYSCELELAPNGTTKEIEKLFKLIYEIMKIIQNSDEIISKSEKNHILDEYKAVACNSSRLKFIGTQPHTLKIEKIKNDEEYALTYKLDGQRYLLFVSENGQGYYISSSLDVKKSNHLFWDIYRYTIFDGEYFQGNFYAFDLMFFKGKQVPTTMTLQDKVYAINEIISINNVSIKCKEYIFPETLYEGFTEYIKNYPKQEHCDGIIIAPTKNSSNTTLKWKPDELNTVDLRVHILNPNKAILLCTAKNSEDLYEYNRKNVTIQGIIKKKEIIANLSHSKIYEFTYNKDTKEFIPLKERTDKIKPNFIEVVHDNLETILYPVNVELIKRNQERFFNLKRFHNWVKRSFLQKYASYKNCIDIGCGRGGDIQKWFDYKIKYIEAYDINEESIAEAINRYTLYKNNNIYKSNYNYNFIIKDLNELGTPLKKSEEKIDVITGFFCMHYFVKSFDAFFENIKAKLSKGSLFICSFQDSDKIDDLLLLNTSKKEYHISKTTPNKISISMCDTIVQETREEDILTNTEIIQMFKSKKFELIDNCEFESLYKPWCEANNSMDEYEIDISFLNRMYVFKYLG